MALLHYGDDFHANNYTNRANNVVHEIDLRWNISNIYFRYVKNAFIISFVYEKFSYIPYLLVYKSTPQFQGQKSNFSSFRENKRNSHQ